MSPDPACTSAATLTRPRVIAPPAPAWLPLRALDTSVALARRFARDITSGHPGDHHDDILVVSELVTNAIRAARTLRAWRPKDLPVRLGICATDRLTRIIVEDPDPVMREPRSGDECGRGLIIVAALAEHLWIDEVIGGKVVIADVTA